MAPLVSILIPAFNSQAWIADTLRSAIAQTWENKEIVVVDDGSTDATLKVARAFESQFVLVVTQSNQGAAAARNAAYGLSRGEYIQWLDADDLLAPDKVAKQMQAASCVQSQRTLFSGAWGSFLYRPSRTAFRPTALWRDLSPADWLVHKMGENLWMQTASWLVSRELSEAAGPWDTGMLSDDDGEYFCRVLMASDAVRFVPDAKVYYRMHGGDSLSFIGQSQRKIEAEWRSLKLHIGYLRSMDDSERARAACVRFLQNWLMTFYPGRPDIVAEATRMARELGGALAPPKLSWKYSWIRRLFGWPAAKHAQQVLPRARFAVEMSVERALARVEGRRPPLSMT